MLQKKPFIAPNRPQTMIPASTAVITCSGCKTNMLPLITPATATSEPTVKSIPPVMITNVIPIASIPFTATCRRILIALDTVLNVGDIASIIIHIMTRTIDIPYFLTNSASKTLRFIFTSYTSCNALLSNLFCVIAPESISSFV